LLTYTFFTFYNVLTNNGFFQSMQYSLQPFPLQLQIIELVLQSYVSVSF
jgi:hypothetical protein